MPRDPVTPGRIKTLHPSIRDKVTLAIDTAEAKMSQWEAIRVTDGFRSFPEQTRIWNQGRTTPGQIVTHAKAGESFHNYGLAIDFALLIDKDHNGTWDELTWSQVLDMDKDGKIDWSEVVEAFKFLGFDWGGDWRNKDKPHCEMNYGHTYHYFLDKYNKRDFIPNTTYINL